ncbi:transposase [Sporolactobacillus terrae]|uniref:transposase n=1 Tax=Sporolactobacillus terrae TaxID=269673 RepID=UPI000A473BAA|nr:transposase [Sporolactobacillus terrae]
MDGYQKSGHAIFDIKYHVIWMTKYRYKVLRGQVAVRLRELIRQGCDARKITIMQGERRQRAHSLADLLSAQFGSE